MESAVTIGLDLGKSVFQVHGVDTAGAVVIQRRLTRGKLLQFFAKQPACLVGMEACAAAHHWGRELSCLIPGFDGAILSPAWRDALWPGSTRLRHDDRGGPSSNTK